MPYSETLAVRVRSLLLKKNPEEKKMMGGLTFMVNGKMCVGILNDDLMARIHPDEHVKALKRRGCREMDFTGKPMKGYVFVDGSGTKSDKDLESWVQLALDFNGQAKASSKAKKAAAPSKKAGPKAGPVRKKAK